MNYPCTIRQAAKKFCVSTSTIRRWVEMGRMIADREAKPMLITAGDPPLRKSGFIEAMCGEAERLGFGRGTYGANAEGEFHILVGLDVEVFPYKDRVSAQREAAEKLARIAERLGRRPS